MGLEPTQALLLNRFSCYSMLPQPNNLHTFLMLLHLIDALIPHFRELSLLITQVVCCSLEYIITILKFLQDNHMSLFLVLQLNGNPYSYLHIIKFQLRYLLYTLYTFMRIVFYIVPFSIQHGIILTPYWLVFVYYRDIGNVILYTLFKYIGYSLCTLPFTSVVHK